MNSEPAYLINKECDVCRLCLPITLFGKHKGKKDGRRSTCRRCRNEALRNRPADDLSRKRDRDNKAIRRSLIPYDDPIRVRERENFRKRYQENREQIRHQQRVRKFVRVYGITPADAERILESQGGVCAVCKTNEWTASGPSVDHCHSTGKVRGILCNRCNAAIGFAKESPDRLRSAAAYLEQFTVRDVES